MKFEDRFSNIDDKTAERLSQKYPFLDEERKARLYTMSKRKSDRNNVPETNNIEVSGVDKYRRPMWYRSVSIAAAAVLVVAGIGGSTFLISRNGKDKAPAASVSEESTAAVTEAVTDAAAEEATIAVEEGTVAAAEAEVDPDAVAKELVDAYTEYLSALFCGTMEVDKANTVTKDYPEGQTTYYHVTDKRYPNLAAVEKRCYEIFNSEFAKDLLEQWNFTKEEDATFHVLMYSAADGSLYIEKESHDDHNGPIKWDQDEIKGTLTPEGNITCELTFSTFDDNIIKTEFTFVKTENGWRISKADESVADEDEPDVVAEKLVGDYGAFFSTFYTGDLDYDKSDVITRNMVSSEDGSNITIDYYRVTDSRLAPGYDLKGECFRIFDEELANSIYENLCCDEDNVTDKALLMKRKDGSYYVMNCWYYEGDKVDKWDQDTVKGTLNSDGTITTVLTKTHNDPAFRKSEYNFTFVKTENGWRISKVDYVEYDEVGNPIEYPVDEGTKEWNNKVRIETPAQEQTSEQNNKATIEIPEEATAVSNN